MSRTSTELVAVTYPSAVALQAPPPPSTKSLSTTTLDAPGRSRSSSSYETRLVSDDVAAHADVSKGKTAVVIASVTCITGISSLLAGLVTIALPTIARDLELADNLLLWYAIFRRPPSIAFPIPPGHPETAQSLELTNETSRPASIYALTCGC